MTVEQFYARAVVDGRAVLSGSAAKPVAWIVRVPGTVRDAYCLCRLARGGVALLDARTLLADIQEQPTTRRYFATAAAGSMTLRSDDDGQWDNQATRP